MSTKQSLLVYLQVAIGSHSLAFQRLVNYSMSLKYQVGIATNRRFPYTSGTRFFHANSFCTALVKKVREYKISRLYEKLNYS